MNVDLFYTCVGGYVGGFICGIVISMLLDRKKKNVPHYMKPNTYCVWCKSTRNAHHKPLGMACPTRQHFFMPVSIEQQIQIEMGEKDE